MGIFLEYVARGLMLGAIYGLLALPMNLLFVTVGTMDFAVGSYALIAAVIGATLGGVTGIVAGIAGAVACSAIMAAIFVLISRKAPGELLSVALASFGLAIAIGSLVLRFCGTATFALQAFDDSWVIGSLRVNPQSAINTAAAGIVLLALLATLYGTDIGRTMRATALNPRGAELAGIPVL